MEYRIKAIIAGREVDDSRDMGLDAPYLANAEINMATSLNPMAIGSSASNSAIISLGNPWKESYDGDEVELFISPLGNTSALELSELEEAVGDATEYEGIDADDTYDDIDDSEEGEDITEDEEAELVESEEENIEAAYLAVNGEDVIITDEETDEEEEAEWISMGKFYVYGQGNNSADNTVRLTCYDMLSRLTDKFEPTVRATTVQALYDDYRAQVMATYGLEVDGFEFNEIYNIDVNWTQPTTYREAIELFAGLVGGFAVIGADNTLGISFYGFNDKVIIDTQVSEYTESSSGEMVLQSITCDRSTQPYKEDKIEVGPGQGIAFANPFVNEEMLADIFAMYNGIRYEGATFKMSWDDSINEGEFLRIMTEEEYKNYVALNNALEAETDAAESLELKGSINSLGKVVLVSNARITLAGDATAKVTSICGTEYAKENPTPSPSTGIFKNLYAEMIQAEYIDAVKVVTKGLEAEDAQIKNLVADSLEVGSINGNVIKDGTVIAAALSHEAVQTLSGNHVYYQAEAPTGGVYLEGDTWYKTVIADADTDKKVLHIWNGSEWVPSDFDARVLRANSITAQEIAANTIRASEVDMDNLQTNLARIGDVNGNHIDINEDGIDIISTYGRDMRYETADLKIGNGEMRLDLDMSGGGFAIGQDRLDLQNSNPGTTKGIALGASNALKERGIAIGTDNASTTNEQNVIMLGNGLVATDNNQVLIGEYNGIDQSRGQAIVVANGTSDKRGFAFGVSNGGTVRAANMRTSGGIYTYSHNTPIGTVVTKSLTGTFSVTTSFKSALNIELGAGVWVVYALVSSNSTVSSATNVRCNIYTESAYNYVQVSHYCPSGQYARFTNTTILELDEAKTVYLNVVGTAAFTLGTNTTLRAVRIA